jgi:hypothetical protein
MKTTNNEYFEKLKDPRWQKKRLEILERDGFTCRICNDTKSTLHIHHIIYFKESEPWEYDDKYLITLCKTCHENESLKKREENKKLFNTISKAGLSSKETKYFNELIEIIFEINDEKEIFGFLFWLFSSTLFDKMYKNYLKEMKELDEYFREIDEAKKK